MIFKLEHAITVTPRAYDGIVRNAANPPSDIPDQLTPWFYDTRTGKNRAAGSIIVAAATHEEFTGSWYINDGTSGRIAAYEDMLLQAGLPARAEYYALQFDQHLAAGSRVEDNIFAMTSLVRCIVPNSPGRKPSAKTVEKRQELEFEMMQLLSGQSLQRGDFDYEAFMEVADRVPLRQPRW